MNLSMWELLINVAALLFWFRLWVPEERDLYFNPYLAALWRFSEQIVGALRAVFIRTPDRLIALLSLLFLLVFRGVVFYGLARRSPDVSWSLHLGFAQSRLQAGNADFLLFLGFSFLSFAMFLFIVWGLATFYAGRKQTSLNYASRTLFHISQPFSLIRMEWRPLVFVAFGVVLALLVNGDIASPGDMFPAGSLTLSNAMKSVLSALDGWVMEVLTVLQLLMLVMILGSWAAMFSTSPALGYFCRDWIELLLGPLRRFPLRLGMFDLTPLIFFLSLTYVIQPALHTLLVFSYKGLP